MVSLGSTVGDGAANQKHDVALVQAMLRVIRDREGHPYLTSAYDGKCDSRTITAIRAFQKDFHTAVFDSLHGFGGLRPSLPGFENQHGLLGLRPQLPDPRKVNADLCGVVRPFGPTLAELRWRLPATHKTIRTAKGATLVYWAGSSESGLKSAESIEKDAQLNTEFRTRIGKLVRTMFDRYELVLNVPKGCGYRTFQNERDISSANTQAGPGTSYHNFGMAVDIGYNGLKWMKGDGSPVTDDYYLQKLASPQSHPNWAAELWEVRNKIAYQELGLFRTNLAGDLSHIQLYSDDIVSTTKSLAVLMDRVGVFGWRFQHGLECDLGLTGTWRKVGSPVHIWDGSGPMPAAWVAATLNIQEQAVTDAQIKSMRKALREDMEAAEAARDQWTPQPK